MCPANPAQKESAALLRGSESSESDSERFFRQMEVLIQAVVSQTEATTRLLEVNQAILLAMAEDQAGVEPDDLPMFITPPPKRFP